MASFDSSGFADRIKNSSAAKAASIGKHKARPGPDDPGVMAKAAERKGLHEARVTREADKERNRQEQLAREVELRRLRDEDELAAALVQEAEIEAQEVAAQTARRERAKLALSSLADQKDVRDARYAARKARQKQAKRG